MLNAPIINVARDPDDEDYLILTWEPVAGATCYDVFRTGGGATARKIASGKSLTGEPIPTVWEPHPGDLWLGPTAIKVRLRCPGTWSFWVVARSETDSSEPSAAWGFSNVPDGPNSHTCGRPLGIPAMLEEGE